MLDLDLPQTEHSITCDVPASLLPTMLSWMDECRGACNFHPIETFILLVDWDLCLEVWFTSANDAILFDLTFRNATRETFAD